MIDWPPPVAIAHRGSRYLWPENTMEAFAGAVSMGYRHIETDLRMTVDGVIVCFHDRTVDRTTNGSGLVSQLAASELESLDAGFRHAGEQGFPFRGKHVKVPRFEEVVTALPDVRFVIDLKSDGMAAELGRIIEKHSLQDKLIVGSFSDRRLREVRDVVRVATSTGSAVSRQWLARSRVGRSPMGPATAIQVPRSLRGVRIVDRKLVEAAHRAGVQVHVWTVNERPEMARLLDLGVDGLVTDRLDVLRDLLESRGQWPT